jgi:IS30 family transposase
MAEQGKQLDEATRRTLERLREVGRSIREAAKESGVAKSTAQKYLKKSA